MGVVGSTTTRNLICTYGQNQHLMVIFLWNGLCYYSAEKIEIEFVV
jgi:hypothetical protein